MAENEYRTLTRELPTGIIASYKTYCHVYASGILVKMSVFYKDPPICGHLSSL